MLKVRAIRKYHDEKGILIGYTIQEEGTTNTMNVHKDQLKAAVANGQCEVVNMTLTSDGRLIGKAAPAPKKREPKRSGLKLVQLWTCGKDTIGALVDVSEYANATGMQIPKLKGINDGCIVELGDAVVSRITSGGYDNLVMGTDGKLDLKESHILKCSFNKVKPKLAQVITSNDVSSKLSTKKLNKSDYAVIIDNYDTLESAGLTSIVNIYKCMIAFAIKNDTKWKVQSIEGNSVVFYGPDSATEAKTILKIMAEKKEK